MGISLLVTLNKFIAISIVGIEPTSLAYHSQRSTIELYGLLALLIANWCWSIGDGNR